jgi:hypothetical protein
MTIVKVKEFENLTTLASLLASFLERLTTVVCRRIISVVKPHLQLCAVFNGGNTPH